MSLAQFIAQFRVLFTAPKFVAITDSQLEIYYNITLAIFGVCNFAQLYLTAHLIVLDITDGMLGLGDATGGTVDGGNGENMMEKVGDLQVQLKTMADTGKDVYFTTTPYGRRYITLRNACPSYRFSARVYPKQ